MYTGKRTVDWFCGNEAACRYIGIASGVDRHSASFSHYSHRNQTRRWWSGHLFFEANWTGGKGILYIQIPKHEAECG